MIEFDVWMLNISQSDNMYYLVSTGPPLTAQLDHVQENQNALLGAVSNVLHLPITIKDKIILHDTNYISKELNNTLIKFDKFNQEHHHISIAILHIKSQ